MIAMDEKCSPEMEKAVKRFKELVAQEPDLKVRSDNNFALRHLRAAEGNAEKAFTKMKVYYQLKRENPEWWANKAPTAYKDLLDMGTDFVLPDRDQSGKRVWITRAAKVDTSRTTMWEIAQMHDLLLETILDEPETQKNGMAIVVDLKDAPWSIIRWMTPANSRISSKKADHLPFPKMEYHVVNNSLFFNVLFKILYPFLSTKQKESIFIHGENWASLHQKIDPSILPKDYGGQKDAPSPDKLHTQIYDYSDQLIVNLNMGYTTKPEKRNSIFDQTINVD